MLMGLYEIRLPIRRGYKPKRGGIIGLFLLGLFFGIVSSPCATPVLVVLLTFVATKGQVIYGIALLFTYTIGHCLLMLAAVMLYEWSFGRMRIYPFEHIRVPPPDGPWTHLKRF